MYTLGASARQALREPLRALPALVLDLDETLLHRPRGLLDQLALYTIPTSSVGVPYAHALPSVRELAAVYNLVAVTARFALAEANTARWLEAQGLGGLPVVYAARVHAGDASRGAFKAAAIRALRQAGWAPAAGVGDRPSDLKAYASEGLMACMVLHAEGAAGGDGAARARARALLAAQGAHCPPGARVQYFTDSEAAREELGLGPGGGGAAAPSVWQQVTACLLAAQPPLPPQRQQPPVPLA